MGTDYPLYTDNSLGELSIDEMSNKLSFMLCFDEDFETKTRSSTKMPPEEMAKVLLYGLQVCSYWMDADELKKLIQEYVEKNIY